MSGVNKVILVGRLGADPEMKFTQGGQAIARLSLATSEQWTDKNSGQKQERTEWHRVVVWGKQAEVIGKFMTKGRQLYVEGRLQTRSWEDPQGQKRYTTEIVANNFQFLGGGNQEASPGAGAGATAGYDNTMNQDFAPEPSFNANDEIPF